MLRELFGTNVFSDGVMARYLPAGQLGHLQRIRSTKEALTMETADAVANAMKTWALEKGATHFCHWFQPLTGNTAQKHDCFLSGIREGEAILHLTGKRLMLGESDASSFPTGGLRETAYARGYTAWDMTSPAFIKEEPAGKILCIPTVFLSHNGEALDTKTPLLRSMDALDAQAGRLLRRLGEDPGKITPYVGAEQEYFLIDRAHYLQRRDLVYCGRTLFGAPAPKGQELDDQYFGSIRHRQGAFMQSVNQALWRLGVPAAVQHNEVAPAQHELACLYSAANIAVDQNQLVMETMKQMAGRYGLVCLLHPKPFAGVNGSGKHNNWSLAGEKLGNLLEPGPAPEENLRFQLILACILRAVDRHAALLRLAAGDPGNDLRLGGQEAPPAVISVYLGDRLHSMVEAILSGNPAAQVAQTTLDTGAAAVPAFEKDASDRNRTSPFAFTGNKFEFRMVGASESLAFANTVLNTIVAEAFSDAADRLQQGETPQALIRQWLTQHQRILFRGDGYSPEWAQEASRRGLPRMAGVVEGVEALREGQTKTLFAQFGVLRPSELESRAEILYETYVKRLRIEANTMRHMTSKRFLPAALGFQQQLAQTVVQLQMALPGRKFLAQMGLLEQIQQHIEHLQGHLAALAAQMEAVDRLQSPKAMAWGYYRQVFPGMLALRRDVDALEEILPKAHWPVPTYGDLLFEV